MMVLVAYEYGLNGDFVKLVNPIGWFVVGGLVLCQEKVHV